MDKLKENKQIELACCEHEIPKTKHAHQDHEHDDHNHDSENELGIIKGKWNLWASLTLLIVFLIIKNFTQANLQASIEFFVMGIAYVLAGHKTIWKAIQNILRGNFFNEFTLMTIATLGAFYIGEFTEGVAVMIFYEIGELFQDFAVNKSKKSIKALLDLRPEIVTVIRNGVSSKISPNEVLIGDTLLILGGEKIALDGKLIKSDGIFNTAALTGESRPDEKSIGDPVLAGMINIGKTVEVEVTRLFQDSKLSKILEMVQDASTRKAPTQLLISRLAKIYTPIVFGLAVLITLVPYFFVNDYIFNDWLYRGMVFLVISCPCALTISIPLGYFGGIGLASRNGILVKGANVLDVITKVDTLITDKTGTMTKGIFEIQEVNTIIDRDTFLKTLISLESYSTHPVAQTILRYNPTLTYTTPTDVEEIPGHGLSGNVEHQNILAGNTKLMKKFSVPYPPRLDDILDTIIIVAIQEKYVGYVTIADAVKVDAAQTVHTLQDLGIQTIMLSGDKSSITNKIANEIGISKSYGDLLPEDKLMIATELKKSGKNIAFVGDGINDAPVVALADVGIAMGGLGSDATIETADVVIQNDQPSKIVTAIHVGKMTRQVVFQNITLAIVVKIIVLLLGAGGVATLWEAIFADVGVSLLAILNAYRIQYKNV
jgi:Cd2+/Zn2+-exporting ATPase